MARKKENQEEKLTKNRTEIRIKTQNLMMALLDKTIEGMNDDNFDKVRGLGVLDKAIKFLALENKIDEGEWGDGLYEDEIEE